MSSLGRETDRRLQRKEISNADAAIYEMNPAFDLTPAGMHRPAGASGIRQYWSIRNTELRSNVESGSPDRLGWTAVGDKMRVVDKRYEIRRRYAVALLKGARIRSE